MVCVRSDTTGPRHGSEFEIRMPLGHKDVSGSSIPGSPLVRTRTPTPTPPTSVERSDTLRPERRPSPHPPARTSDDHHNHVSPSITVSDKPPLDTDREQRQHQPLDESTVIPTPQPPSIRTTTISIPAPSTHPRPPPISRQSTFDRTLALKHPLTFLVVEDNHINRKLLVNMLSKLGYRNIHQAYDGVDAVRQMTLDLVPPVDVILMDLWMPSMDGFEATKRILSMPRYLSTSSAPIANGDGPHDANDDSDGRKDSKKKKGNGNGNEVVILAVTADATDEASARASEVGMKGLMTKPYKLVDLERAILEYCLGDRQRPDGRFEDDQQREQEKQPQC